MKSPKNHPGPRVFIVGLSFCQIVYLPETGQIVSRLESRPAPVEDPKIATARAADEEAPE